jgi:hypothetical protein
LVVENPLPCHDGLLWGYGYEELRRC